MVSGRLLYLGLSKESVYILDLILSKTNPEHHPDKPPIPPNIISYNLLGLSKFFLIISYAAK